MARLTFPDEGSRLLYDPATGQLLPVNTRVYLYLDAAATQAATDLLDAGGTPITVGYVASDAFRRLPLFQGPTTGADTLYAVVGGTGPITPIYARTDDRLDTLNTRVGALETDSPATAVQSVNGHTGTAVTVTKGDVGLGNVDNTSDVNKPVSTAQAAADAAVLSTAEGYTDTKVTALVNSAPGILDTLGEIATQLQSDESAATALTATVAGKQNVVVHGATAGTARPAGATLVHWVGSVQPTNAATNDEWTDTANKALKRWTGSVWDSIGSGSYAALLTPTATKTANYTAAPSDLVVCDTTSAAFTVTLPTTPADATRIGAKIITQGGTNGVTVAAGGSDHIATGNATTRSLKILGEAVELQYQASTALWFVAASDTPVTQLDGRYAALTETVNTVGTSGAAQTIPNPTVGGNASINRITLTANCTLTFPTATAGASFTLVLVQDATGSRTVTWPGTVKWAAATAPTLSTGATKVDVLSFVCADGTNWLGFVSGQDMR